MNAEPLTTDAIRDKLAGASGRLYWRSLDELADTAEFRDLLHREFPREASVWDDGALSRRSFLHLMGASLALAGLSGCSNQPNNEKILPYVRQPENMTLGEPLLFATSMPRRGGALGLLVKSREGRPIKIEGNPDHPSSLGSTDHIAQASILTLYDPDRSQTIKFLGEISTWEAFLAEVRETLQTKQSSGGRGVHVLSEPVNSPTLARQRRQLQEKYAELSWHTFEPCNRDNVREGAGLAFGEDRTSIYRFDQAKIVLAIDSDFLCSGAGAVRYARDFMSRRKVRDDQSEMNRLWCVESAVTPTGSVADHRLPLPPGGVQRFVVELAQALNVSGAASIDLPSAESTADEKEKAQRSKWLEALVSDLQSNRGASAVLAGDHQPGWVHALVHAINSQLGNFGETVELIEPSNDQPTNQMDSLRRLVDALHAEQVDLLLILGGNPLYNTPAALDFRSAIRKARRAVHLSLHEDETSEYCHWHLPAAHYLESWGDARGYDGTLSLIQPLIAPLYDGKTAYEVLSAMIDPAVREPYDLVRETWKERYGDDEKAWREALHAGYVKDSAHQPMQVSIDLDAGRLTEAIRKTAPTAAVGDYELVFLPDFNIHTGEHANNGWLQELPRPLTKLTWDNPALVSPATAEALGVKNEDVVSLSFDGRKLEAPVWIVPGHPNDTVTVHFGFGRRRGGRTLSGAGFDFFQLWPDDGRHFGAGLRITKTGQKYPLACTQLHHMIDTAEERETMQRRGIVRSATLAEFRAHPERIHGGHDAHATPTHGDHGHDHGEQTAARLPSLYPDFPYNGFKWGMAIDMTACMGCNACVVACQAENNIPIVGKEGVIRGREMHWLRIDSYYSGDIENPEATHQPMLCQHCEKAPCEVVCPVAATTHSAEGLNEMTYNRCVGTRYCSNNCPYKVRRFNFLEYNQYDVPVLKLLHNPEVTVRSRGVMEKCTYCVQRINNARIEAKKDSVDSGEKPQIEDGSLMTACQQACPSRAIVFGDMNDEESAVAKLKNSPLNYGVLAEIGTVPRTTYLARLRNPHPDLT